MEMLLNGRKNENLEVVGGFNSSEKYESTREFLPNGEKMEMTF